jgi:ComF family protein
MFTDRLLQHPAAATIIDFVYPPLCAGCGENADNPSLVCEQCRNRFDLYSHPFCLVCRAMLDKPACPTCRSECIPLFAFGNYVDPLKRIVLELKFHSVTQPLRHIVEEFTKAFGEDITARRPDCLVPVPLHPGRAYSRGYNQAELIARELADRLQVPVDLELVVRSGKRRPQQDLPASRRADNIRGVFELTAISTDPRRIVIVDDVVTSGQTAKELARTLIEGGHRVVAVASLVHGD